MATAPALPQPLLLAVVLALLLLLLWGGEGAAAYSCALAVGSPALVTS